MKIQDKSVYNEYMQVIKRSAINGRLFNVDGSIVQIFDEPIYFIRCDEKHYTNMRNGTFEVSDKDTWIKILGGNGMFYFTFVRSFTGE